MSTHKRGDSNEYPQHMRFKCTKQNYPLIITKYLPYLLILQSFVMEKKLEKVQIVKKVSSHKAKIF